MSKIIVQGVAQGTVLKTTSPINFLGAVDKKTGVIHDKKYDIFEKSVWERPHVEEPEIAVSQRHAEFLLETYNLIPDILNNINNENWELAAASLKSAAIALGNIIGEDATLDIYETIFSKFCIGK